MSLRNKTAGYRKIKTAVFLLSLILTIFLASFVKAGLDDTSSENENILVFATDDRLEFHNNSDSNADMILAITVNRKSRSVKMVNLYRNIGVEDVAYSIPRTIRLKAAYREGGVEGLKEQLKKSFGLEFDAYVRVNMQAVIKAVDSLGGVDIELTEEEADYMNNANPELSYENPYNLPDRVRYFVSSPVHEGINHMDGITAVVYARCRNVDGEISRMDRVKTLLIKSLQKGSGLSIGQAVDLAKTLSSSVQTDMGVDRIVSLASLAPEIDSYTFESLSVPEEGEYEVEDNGGNPVFRIDMEKARSEIERFINHS